MNENKLMNNINETIESNLYLKLVKGLGVAFLFTLISIFIFSIILTYTNIQESTIPVTIIIISAISILLGSTVATRSVNKNGMLKGGIIGVTYVFFLYIISSILNTGFLVNIYTIIMLVTGVIAGLIGGILGINS